MINNKKQNPIVTELFIRGRKLNISIAFFTKSSFKVPKDVRLDYTHFFIMKIPDKREFEQIEINHSSDIDFKNFMKIQKKYTAKPYSLYNIILYRKCTIEPYSFLVNDTNLQSDNQLRFRKNLLE